MTTCCSASQCVGVGVRGERLYFFSASRMYSMASLRRASSGPGMVGLFAVSEMFVGRMKGWNEGME